MTCSGSNTGILPGAGQDWNPAVRGLSRTIPWGLSSGNQSKPSRKPSPSPMLTGRLAFQSLHLAQLLPTGNKGTVLFHLKVKLFKTSQFSTGGAGADRSRMLFLSLSLRCPFDALMPGNWRQTWVEGGRVSPAHRRPAISFTCPHFS